MPVATVFSGVFCREDPVVGEIVSRTGYGCILDRDLVAEASGISGMAEAKIGRVFSAKTSVFNTFTYEKERSIAYLKLALARNLAREELLVAGFAAHLLPKEISHVLRVCLIADMKSRVSVGRDERGASEKEITKFIHKHDEDRAAWVFSRRGTTDPWDASLYDMVIPLDKMSVEAAVTLIVEHLGRGVLIPTEESLRAVDDFLLAADTEVALAKEGHVVEVSARAGAVTLTINRHVLMLSHLEEELKSIAEKVPGVESVRTTVGKGFHKTDIYRKFDFESPSKVLLVDDEREFVQTLSERLSMRDMGSAVAYDGESALDLVDRDEPEVMILDLKMPGIDGIEVLRRVKKTRPKIEVIILTGHGSEADKDTCMNLGAFAYLQKPVDIEILSETLKKANEKIRSGKAGQV